MTAVQIGDYVYGSSGCRENPLMAAVNIKTGAIAWRKRGFPWANLICADGRVILLDENGNLALVTASPDDFTVHAKVKVLDAPSWTVPTVVGKTLYVRDLKRIMALDLG